MATVERSFDSGGNPIFRIRVSGGTGRRVSRTWKPPEGWSERTIQKELGRLCCQLEEQFASGELLTASEKRQKAQKVKTFSEYAEKVFIPFETASKATNTAVTYQRILNLYVLPKWADLPLEQISAAMANRLLLELSTEKSHSTTVLTRACLQALFNLAVDTGVLAANPIAGTKIPKRRKDSEPEKKKILTPEELDRIFAAAKEEPLMWRAIIVFLGDSGARRGEAAALKWENLDLRQGTARICQTMIQAPGGPQVGATKTGSERIVDLGPETIDLLRQWRQEQSKTCFSPWCFTKARDPSKPIGPNDITERFRRLGQKCKIEGLHPHRLRHSVASYALQNGADIRSVADRLGHADVATTLNVYSHSTEASRRKAGDLARAAIF